MNQSRHFKRRRSTDSSATAPLSTALTRTQAVSKLEAFAFRTSNLPQAREDIVAQQIEGNWHQHANAYIKEGAVENDGHQHALDAIVLQDDKQMGQKSVIYGRVITGACDALMEVVYKLSDDLKGYTFKPPVTCVYNPLVYAIHMHEQYVRKHGGQQIEVLLVGMNPGPFGMAQTGVPFGDATMVRDFHGLSGHVESPVPCHPKRPIYGLQCPRSEVSGQRLWGWARDRFGSAAAFFRQFWVYNYCPLVFMEASGKNRTPDKLHPIERRHVENVCNKALSRTVSILQPLKVVGIGKYAANKIRECGFNDVEIGEIMHPSPANPQANKEWSQKIEAQLLDLGVSLTK